MYVCSNSAEEILFLKTNWKYRFTENVNQKKEQIGKSKNNKNGQFEFWILNSSNTVSENEVTLFVHHWINKYNILCWEYKVKLNLPVVRWPNAS